MVGAGAGRLCRTPRDDAPAILGCGNMDVDN